MEIPYGLVAVIELINITVELLVTVTVLVPQTGEASMHAHMVLATAES